MTMMPSKKPIAVILVSSCPIENWRTPSGEPFGERSNPGIAEVAPTMVASEAPVKLEKKRTPYIRPEIADAASSAELLLAALLSLTKKSHGMSLTPMNAIDAIPVVTMKPITNPSTGPIVISKK